MSDFLAMPVFFFTVYSFLGWLLENCYNYVIHHIFLKPNFIKGPFKPMYGLTPIFLVYLITPETHWASVLFLCLIVPTMIEYISGAMLQKLTNRHWWNYSNLPLQFNGHICLSFSLCWFGLSFFCVKVLHPAVMFLFGKVESIFIPIWPLIYLYFIIELIIAMRRHSSRVQSASNASSQL